MKVKPNFMLKDPCVLAKIEGAQKWCSENNFKFEVVSDCWFEDNCKKIDFMQQPHLKDKLKMFLK